jgi:hypothetical protein
LVYKKNPIFIHKKGGVMATTLKIAGLGLLFLLMVLSGIWLSKAGRPYDPVLFNVHKVISVLAVVLAGIWVYYLYRGSGGSSLQLTLMVAGGVLYLLLIVSGGLLNLELSFSPVLRSLHRILPAVALVVTFVLFYGLLKKG